MAGVEAAGVALASIPLLLSGSGTKRDWLDLFTFQDFRESLRRGRNKRLREDYGLVRTLLLLWAFPDGLNVIDRIERDVLNEGVDHGAVRTRDAVCAKYNAVAVAVRRNEHRTLY